MFFRPTLTFSAVGAIRLINKSFANTLKPFHFLKLHNHKKIKGEDRLLCIWIFRFIHKNIRNIRDFKSSVSYILRLQYITQQCVCHLAFVTWLSKIKPRAMKNLAYNFPWKFFIDKISYVHSAKCTRQHNYALPHYKSFDYHFSMKQSLELEPITRHVSIFQLEGH